MPLDPDVIPLIQHLYGVSFAQLIAGEAGGPAPEPAPVAGVEIENATIDGPHGAVPVRIYRLEGSTGPQPAIVWSHGGGWQFGDLDMPEADAVAARVAAALPGVVVSVDYRMAPAHHHPVPVDDVLAVFDDVVARAGARGVDATRVGIGGASAGAHLSALAAIALRDRAAGASLGSAVPAALVLAYPATDPVDGPYPDERPDECPEVMWLNGPIVAGLFALYLGGGDDGSAMPAVPATAVLAGLPPVLVTTAGYDALTTQAERFVGLLEAAGVPVTHHHEAGLLHGYLNMVGVLPAADRALDHHAAWLRDTLSNAPAVSST